MEWLLLIYVLDTNPTFTGDLKVVEFATEQACETARQRLLDAMAKQYELAIKRYAIPEPNAPALFADAFCTPRS